MILAVAIAIAVGLRDARDRLIPNKWSGLLGALGAGFQLLRALGARWGLPWERAVAASEPTPAACLASAALVLAGGILLELAYRHRTGREGLGLGDVKYLAAWTLVVGPVAIACFSVASLLGAVVAILRHERDFALGPWISACCVVWLVACPWL